MKRYNIMVTGGLDTERYDLDKPVEEIIEFAQHLGRNIISQGHNLVSAARNELDRIVAESAFEELSMQPQESTGDEIARRIVCYVPQGTRPTHNCGTILESDVADWDIGGLQLTPPEVVKQAHVVILIGGFLGTYKAANWARLEHKPLLPFSIFGGQSKEVYRVEMKRFDSLYGDYIDRLEYDQVLKSLSNNWEELASKTITLAEKIATSPNVFVIMSFKEASEYKDLYASIKRVAHEFDYEARRVDESNINKRILPEITRQIRQSAFVIADISEPKANVYYELGFADGLAKDVLIIAKKGTELPFDVNDIPVLFWDSFADFEEGLRHRIARIADWLGR